VGEAKRRAERLGDAPIEEKYRLQMNALARALDNLLNGDKRGEDATTGFCLMMFDIGIGPGRANYISNVKREDVIMLLKEQLARFQGQLEIEGHA
jgi:hypothetical protein